jgi:predicted amidophosphoribosyltransferase
MANPIECDNCGTSINPESNDGFCPICFAPLQDDNKKSVDEESKKKLNELLPTMD